LRKTVLRLSLVLGLLLFALVVWRSGPERILADLASLSVLQLAALMALRAVYWILRTFNWRQVYCCYEAKQPFLRLFEARLADNAVGFLTPSAMLGGLPVRALMLEGVDRRRVFASVVLDKTIEALTMASYTVLAMLAAVLILPMSGAARLVFGVFIVVASVFCIAVVAGQRRGLFIGVIDLLARAGIRLRWVEDKRDSLREVDVALAEFYRERRAKIPAVVGLYTLAYLIWAVEIDVTLRFLGAPDLTFIKSLLVISLGNVAFLLPGVPASLGVYELTNVGVFKVLGWSAGMAVALSVIRRLLALAWTAFGLLALYWRQRRSGSRRGAGS
jgi:uncharacterized protein (TIRG00374 family)